jgi:hypothetical protein
LNNRNVAIALLIALLIVSSIAVYQQTLMLSPPKSPLASTQTVTAYSSGGSPELLGSSGFVHIMIPGNSGSTCYCFYYFRANGSDQQSFYFGNPIGNQSGTTYHSANFSEYRSSPGVAVIGLSCKYYAIAFQDKYSWIPHPGPSSSENLSVCALDEGSPTPVTTSLNFTTHTNPQAGLAYAPNGVLYFLVSEE